LSCFESKRLVVRTWDSFFQTTSSEFVDIPAAGLNMVVPAGSDCLIVDFNALVTPTFANTGCWFRALINGTPMSPGPSGRPAIYNDPNGETLAFSWSETVTVATQTTFLIKVQLKTAGNPNGICSTQFWQLKVDRRE
jgi:hypothetical protein